MTAHRISSASARQSNPGPRLAEVAGADAVAEWRSWLTSAGYSGLACRKLGDIFDFENLLPELIVGLGLALLVGNGLAWWRHRQGRAPEGVENPQFRGGRVVFLMVVGAVMTAWGTVSLLT